MSALVPVRDLTAAEARAFLREHGVLTPAEHAALDRLLDRIYFVIRNDGGDYRERMPCFAHGPQPAYHDFDTYRCRVRPYTARNLSRYLYRGGIARVRSADARMPVLTERVPDLAESHPRTARAEWKPDGAGEDFRGFRCGTAEQITESDAARLTLAIRAFDPTFEPSQ